MGRKTNQHSWYKSNSDFFQFKLPSPPMTLRPGWVLTLQGRVFQLKMSLDAYNEFQNNDGLNEVEASLCTSGLSIQRSQRGPRASLSSVQFISVQFSRSVMSTLCGPMTCSTPGLPIHHQLPEFTKTHVHWVGDAIQPSHPLSSPSPPTFNLSQHQGLFKWVSSSYQVAQVLEFQLHHQSFQWIFRTDFL